MNKKSNDIKKNNDQDLLKYFNIGNTFQESESVFFQKLQDILSEESFKELTVRNSKYSEQKTSNLRDRNTENTKVIRLKEDSSKAIESIHNNLNNAGFKISLAVLADFLILKGLEKI